MKEKDPILNAFDKMGTFKLPEKSVQDLASFLKEKILRDKEIGKKFSKKKK